MPCAAAISTHDCDGRTIVVHLRPSASSIRTSTSVIVPCSPTKSIRFPERPPGPASIVRRSSSESESSWTVGSFTLTTPSGIFSMTGRRIPERTGVRHRMS